MNRQSRFLRRARGKGARKARAAAIVEFAVVLPVLLTILFGIIEYGWVFMIRQTLQNAAREGCRVAILSTTVDPYANVDARVDQVMAPTGLARPTFAVNMTHATVADPTETIEVTVPYSSVSLVGGFFGISDYTLRGTCSMRKE